MSYDVVAFGLRLSAVLVWVVVFALVLADRLPFTYLRRVLTLGSLVAVLVAVAYGGAVALGLVPAAVARTLYTAVATAILIGGLTVLTPEPR